MKKLPSLLLGLLLPCMLPATVRSDTGNDLECAGSAMFLAPTDSPDRLKYAGDREVQMVHLALEVWPDFSQRTIEATAVLRFKPVNKPVREVKFDAVDLRVHSLVSSEKLESYQATDQNITVTFADPVPVDKETTVTINYSAEPEDGLYFRTPEMGYKEGDTHLFSQGEEISARHWYPCLDSPNQMFTSEITCHVPEGMTVISNGRLISSTNVPGNGLVVFHWSQEKPHANYLISLVAGYFKKLEDKCGDVPLGFYTPPSEFNEASNSFWDTKSIMAFFQKEIGVPYPWPKYDQTCVNDFVAGGMENTSATTLSDRTLFTAATENIRSSQGLIAHEMAHQWFGDLVTCKDWSQTWLNEGFATFYEHLYEGEKQGSPTLLARWYEERRQLTGNTNDFNPIVRRTYDQPREMFNNLSYSKASWVLHMLRSQLGEDLFRRCVQTYLQRHEHGNVATEDLRAVIEELSGRPWDRFFDQWFYHGHFPELSISCSWDQPTRLEKITVRQTQPVNQEVLLYNLPLTVRFKGKSGVTDQVIQVTRKEEDFYFRLESAPDIVRVDPDCALLAKLQVTVPTSMLYAQLADKEDVVGRLAAIEQLEEKRDKETVAKLKGVLNDDPLYRVRIEAARALRTIHTDEALAALVASTQQPDARVREQVATSIGGFYSEKAYGASRQTVEQEKNPDILGPALQAMAGYAKPAVRETLVKELDSESYRNQVAESSIRAIRLQDDPTFIPPLMDTLSRRGKEFTSTGFGQGLSALGYLGRNEQKKVEICDFIVGWVNDKRRPVQLGSIRALGTLGEPRAIAVLDKFASGTRSSPERAAAEVALVELRAGRKPADDFKNLRQNVLDL
jgi:aminopeptidase N